jgi:hypothetical protein
MYNVVTNDVLYNTEFDDIFKVEPVEIKSVIILPVLFNDEFIDILDLIIDIPLI